VAAVRHSVQEVVQALHDSHGLVSVAAATLGCTRQAVYKRIGASPAIAAARDDAREAMLDVAEQALYERVKAGDAWAVTFYLKTQGRGRGYGERAEIALPRDDAPSGAELPRRIAAYADVYRLLVEHPPEPQFDTVDLTDPIACEAASTIIERAARTEHQAYLDRTAANGHGPAQV